MPANPLTLVTLRRPPPTLCRWCCESSANTDNAPAATTDLESVEVWVVN